MMRDRHGLALAPPPAVWPPDDTEEEVPNVPFDQARTAQTARELLC